MYTLRIRKTKSRTHSPALFYMNFYSKKFSKSMVLFKIYAQKFDKNANLTTLQPFPKCKNRPRARLCIRLLPATLTPYVYIYLYVLPMGLRGGPSRQRFSPLLCALRISLFIRLACGFAYRPLSPALRNALLISLFIRITYTFTYMFYL